MSTRNNNNYLKFPHSASVEGPVSKALKFLLTDRGRTIIAYAAGTVSLGVSIAFLVKDTCYLDKFMNRFQAYEDKFPMEVPEKLEERIDACMDKAKMSAPDSVQVKSLMVTGFDVLPFGSSRSKYFGYVGVPINYLYESINDIDKVNFKLGEKLIDWNSQFGQLLAKSIVLTDDEKDFGFLKTVLELRNSNFEHGAIIPGACILGLYRASGIVNEKLGLYHRPRALRLLSYTILTASAYGIYSVVTKMIRIRHNVKVDKSIAELGPEWCETGVRFYEKLMNKNVALRELNGDHTKYTENGNENLGWLRNDKLPLSTRKLFFKHRLDETRKKEAEDAEKIAKQSTEIDDKVKT